MKQLAFGEPLDANVFFKKTSPLKPTPLSLPQRRPTRKTPVLFPAASRSPSGRAHGQESHPLPVRVQKHVQKPALVHGTSFGVPEPFLFRSHGAIIPRRLRTPGSPVHGSVSCVPTQLGWRGKGGASARAPSAYTYDFGARRNGGSNHKIPYVLTQVSGRAVETQDSDLGFKI